MVKTISEHPPMFFLSPKDLVDRTLRVDVYHYHPRYMKIMGLIERARAHHYQVERLGEVTRITRILGFETEKLVRYVDRGVPYLRVQNIKEFRIDLTNVKRISLDAHKKLKRSQLRPNDVVLTITGRVGTAAVVPSTVGECNASQEIVRIRVKEEVIDPNYVAVYLNSEFGKRLLERWYTGSSTRASRTLIKNVRRIPIIIPTKEIQTQIVDKVMLLKQRRNTKLLEADSYFRKALEVLQEGYRSIYKILGIKSQPIDSETIFVLPKEKLSNRFDVGFYSNENKYSLQSKFPIKKMGEIVEFSDETTIPRKKPLSKFRYVQIQNVDPESGKIVSYTELLGKYAPSRARKIIRQGDIITAMAGSATGTPHHSTAIVTEEFDGYVASTGFGVLKPKERIDIFFVYFMLRSGYILDEIRRRLTGAAIPAITKSEFKRIEIPVPSLHIQNEIVSIMNRFIKKSERLKLRAKNLIKGATELDRKAEREMRKALSIETN